MSKTCVLLLLDGLGDRAQAQFQHQTPLQFAETPCLDRLASLSSTGLYHAGKLGQPLPSENAHFAMFGSPKEEFPGRGPLEALGAEIDLGENDVAMLAHFCSVLETLENQLTLKYDRICGTPEEIDSLYDAADHFEQDGISIRLHKTGGMFSVLTMHGEVSPFITDSNPMVDGRFISEIRPLTSHAADPKAIKTAKVLREYLRWAYRRLCKVDQNQLRIKQKLPPINGLVTQRAGILRDRSHIRDRYGLCGLSMASGFMYKGLASYLGMDFKQVRDTRDPGRDIAERLKIAADNVDNYNFIHVHTKAPDRAGHTKNPKSKVKVIEALDRGIAEGIDVLLKNEEVLLVVTADHSTPSSGGLVHSGEPVPVMFLGDGVRRDKVEAFDEISVAGGALSCLRGDEMMHMILNYLDLARLGGIHDSPYPQQFWPGDYDPFTVVPEPIVAESETNETASPAKEA
ncbi:alkaline phosphatase family protein [Pseudodesulfovibrio piezophilus]|uniref:Phosphonopyruvate decarboxylase-related protein n=1 Tax=Pseudodesulfovibrio piezophilus (strain DSM 21447 / JCM 15486 / C1TLV30) TaxID=1322246 RepID=M1WKZ4_PSEP2|nr:alkaline phosphatase family protein [Pseudodesulfovibrio piezophilus]CCH50451.1 Phosphonopyruvate decarboxylase-related protein [Pseudodesulfovibrio piezophilus C1TLV30]